MALVAVCTFCAGCPGDDPPPDAPDGTVAGLTIEWQTRPETIPGDGPNNARIERATFNLAMLRVVSDGGPIDLSSVTLAWADQERPVDVTIDNAPSGLYSRCLFELAPMEGAPYAYAIEGEIDVGGESREFVIIDATPLAISIDYSVTLPPGGNETIPVEFDLGRVIGVVDIAMVPFANGRYTIDSSSTELADVRQVLQEEAIDVDD